MTCIVALDVGTKTIGVARCADGSTLVTPLMTIARRGVRKDTARLVEILAHQNAQAVVVGLPFELSGEEGRSARLARQIGEAVGEATGLIIHYQDEQYSTLEASRLLYEQGLSSRQQRHKIDQAAAAVILKDWLAEQSGD